MSAFPRSYVDAAKAELENWPGVKLRFEQASKHGRAIVSIGDAERFVMFPMTPSDSRRGTLNFLTDLRSALRAIGATRIAPSVTANTRREVRRAPRAIRASKLPAITDPRPDGFAALRDLQERMRETPAPIQTQQAAPWWRNILNAFRRAA